MPDKWKVGDKVQVTLQGIPRTGTVTQVSATTYVVQWDGGAALPYAKGYADQEFSAATATPPAPAPSIEGPEAAPPAAPVAQPAPAAGALGAPALSFKTPGVTERVPDPEDRLRQDMLGRLLRGDIDLPAFASVSSILSQMFTGLGDQQQREAFVKQLEGSGVLNTLIGDARAAGATKQRKEAEQLFEEDFQTAVVRPLLLRMTDPRFSSLDMGQATVTVQRLSLQLPILMNQFLAATGMEPTLQMLEFEPGVPLAPLAKTSGAQFLKVNLRDILTGARPDLTWDSGVGGDMFADFTQAMQDLATRRVAEGRAAAAFDGAFARVRNQIISGIFQQGAPPSRVAALTALLTPLGDNQDAWRTRSLLPLQAGIDPLGVINDLMTAATPLALIDKPDVRAALGAGDFFTQLGTLLQYESPQEKAQRLAKDVEAAADVARQNNARAIIQTKIGEWSGATPEKGYSPEQIALIDATLKNLRGAYNAITGLALQNPSATADELVNLALGGAPAPPSAQAAPIVPSGPTSPAPSTGTPSTGAPLTGIPPTTGGLLGGLPPPAGAAPGRTLKQIIQDAIDAQITAWGNIQPELGVFGDIVTPARQAIADLRRMAPQIVAGYTGDAGGVDAYIRAALAPFQTSVQDAQDAAVQAGLRQGLATASGRVAGAVAGAAPPVPGQTLTPSGVQTTVGAQPRQAMAPEAIQAGEGWQVATAIGETAKAAAVEVAGTREQQVNTEINQKIADLQAILASDDYSPGQKAVAQKQLDYYVKNQGLLVQGYVNSAPINEPAGQTATQYIQSQIPPDLGEDVVGQVGFTAAGVTPQQEAQYAAWLAAFTAGQVRRGETPTPITPGPQLPGKAGLPTFADLLREWQAQQERVVKETQNPLAGMQPFGQFLENRLITMQGLGSSPSTSITQEQAEAAEAAKAIAKQDAVNAANRAGTQAGDRAISQAAVAAKAKADAAARRTAEEAQAMTIAATAAARARNKVRP